MVTYPAMLDVPCELIRFVARLLRAERRARGTRKDTRRLTCRKQALFAIAWFRDKPNITRHGAAFGLSQSTAYRYLHEAVDVLAAHAPDLHQALEKTAAGGLPHLELDGKIFDSDRCREKTVSAKGETIDAWFSGKTGGFGGNVQMLCGPDGFPIWFGDVLPGGVVDIEAARLLVLQRCIPTPRRCRSWPIPATKAQVTASSNPATNILAIDNRCQTASSVSCAAAANAARPTHRTLGPHSDTPLSAPEESATSSAPHTSSPSSSTAGSAESH